MKNHFWIIWTGNIAHKHVLSLMKLEQNIWVYDIDTKKAQAFGSKYNIPVYNSLDELLSECNVIAICTPHDTHSSIIKTVLLWKNRICICEKPLCIVSNDFIEINDYDAERIYLMHQNRFNSAIVETKRIIESWVLWKIYFIKGFTKWHRDNEYYSPSPWRGKISKEWWILYNQWIHNIDTALWLIDGILGKKIDIVSCFKDKFRDMDIETEDFVSSILRISDIIYEFSIVTYGDKWISENSLIITWANGSIKISGSALNVLEYTNIGWSLTYQNKWEDFDDIYWTGHYKFYSAFIHGERASLPKFQDGISIVKTIEEMYQKNSWWTRVH